MSDEQRSESWFKSRAGKVTASRFTDAIAMNKRTGQPTEARNTYMREVVAAILSGEPKPEIQAQSLAWGIEVEPYARAAYELETGYVVTEAKFMLHPLYEFIGGSSDGLVNDDGLIEIKSPKDPQVHIKTWLNGMDDDHLGQVQGNLFVTGRKWLDFISFDPRQTEPYRLYLQRVWRDEEYIKKLEDGLLAFWDDVQAALVVIEQKVKDQAR